MAKASAPKVVDKKFVGGKVDVGLWRRMKAACAERGIKVAQFLGEAVEEKLGRG